MLKSVVLPHYRHWSQWGGFQIEMYDTFGEDTGYRTQEKKNHICLIILCFCVLMGLFFYSWWEFCWCWTISKTSPVPPSLATGLLGSVKSRSKCNFVEGIKRSSVSRRIMYSAFFAYVTLWLTIVYICRPSCFFFFFLFLPIIGTLSLNKYYK